MQQKLIMMKDSGCLRLKVWPQSTTEILKAAEKTFTSITIINLRGSLWPDEILNEGSVLFW
jgi:hypothetical protein